MYSSLKTFLDDAETLHAAQLEQATRRTMRFSGQVVNAQVQGRLTALEVWIEPATLSRLVSFGLEIGGGVAVVAGTSQKLGYVTHLSAEDGLMDVALDDMRPLPPTGAAVRGEIRPLEFLIRQEMKSLALVVASQRTTVEGLLRPLALPPILKYQGRESSRGHLNEPQRDFIQMAAGTPDLALLWGPPGTGKTETLAHLLSKLLARGDTVLLAAQQHGALDECLIRLAGIRELGPETVIRLGHPAKVAPSLHHLVQPLDPDAPPRLIACTLAACHSGILEAAGITLFDHVAIDEAGRATLTSVLPVIARARRSWVLAGDEEQLLPIVPECARNMECAQSPLHYYRSIREIESSRTIVLTMSYRFGSAAVAAGTQRYYRHHGVILECPRATDRAPGSLVFVDSSSNPSQWHRYGGGFSMANVWEAAATLTLAQDVARRVGGLDAHVRILTPFRLQRALIQRLLRGRHRGIVGSIDQSQGQEADTVILSLAADTPDRMRRHLPAQKLNVAWSRTRYQLFLIGNFQALAEAYEDGRLDRGAAVLVEVVLERGQFEGVQVAAALLERARQKLSALCSSPNSNVAAVERGPRAKTVLGELNRIPRAERGLLLGVHRIRRRRH